MKRQRNEIIVYFAILIYTATAAVHFILIEIPRNKRAQNKNNIQLLLVALRNITISIPTKMLLFISRFEHFDIKKVSIPSIFHQFDFIN